MAPTPEELQVHRDRMQAFYAQQQAQLAREPAPLEGQDAIAAAICEGRGEMARGQYPSRSILGLDATMAGMDVRKACRATYQRTGIMPSY